MSVLSTLHTPPSLPPLLTSHSIPYSPHLSHLHSIHAHFLPHPLIYHLHTLAFLTHLCPLLVPPSPVPLISFLHIPRPFPYQPHLSLFPLISLRLTSSLPPSSLPSLLSFTHLPLLPYFTYSTSPLTSSLLSSPKSLHLFSLTPHLPHLHFLINFPAPHAPLNLTHIFYLLLLLTTSSLLTTSLPSPHTTYPTVSPHIHTTLRTRMQTHHTYKYTLRILTHNTTPHMHTCIHTHTRHALTYAYTHLHAHHTHACKNTYHTQTLHSYNTIHTPDLYTTHKDSQLIHTQHCMQTQHTCIRTHIIHT